MLGEGGWWSFRANSIIQTYCCGARPSIYIYIYHNFLITVHCLTAKRCMNLQRTETFNWKQCHPMTRQAISWNIHATPWKFLQNYVKKTRRMNSGPYSKLWTHINKHPNPATEALPVSMLFRDDMKSTFPKPALNQKNTQEERERGRKKKNLINK